MANPPVSPVSPRPPSSALAPAGRRHLRNAVRVIVSAGLLVALFRFGGVDVRAVGDVIAAALGRPGSLLAAVVLYCLAGSLVRGLRWQALVRPLGHPLTLGRATELFLVGTFFNQVLPTGMGGDVPKTLLLARDGQADGLGRVRAASSVLLDRALGLMPLLAIGLIALPLAGDGISPVVMTLLAGFGVVGLLGLAMLVRADVWRPTAERLPGIGWLLERGAIKRFIGSFAEYGPRALVVATGWGFTFAVLLIGANAFLGRAVGIPVAQAGLAQWALVVPLVALSILLPSLAGWGVREWSYVALLGALAAPVPAATATAVSLLFQALNLMLALVGGLLYALRGDARGIQRSGSAAGSAAS